MVRKRNATSSASQMPLDISHRDTDEGIKGHSGRPRLSLTRFCCLVVLGILIPLAVMESNDPEETNLMLRKLEAETLQEVELMEGEVAAATGMVFPMQHLLILNPPRIPTTRRLPMSCPSFTTVETNSNPPTEMLQWF